jgi:hypothetical protein
MGPAPARSLQFLQRVQVVQEFEKKQIGNLLDDFEGVGDAAGPESIPDAVNLITDFTGEHE